MKKHWQLIPLVLAAIVVGISAPNLKNANVEWRAQRPIPWKFQSKLMDELDQEAKTLYKRLVEEKLID